MTNIFVEPRFLERVDRLALGVELRDALRLEVPASHVAAVVDGDPSLDAVSVASTFEQACAGLRRLSRRGPGRFVVLQKDMRGPALTIRIFDANRFFIPRRLRFELSSGTPAASLIRRVALAPGAGYNLTSGLTGIRGQVLWDAASMLPGRWARVEARVAGTLVGRASVDDRGEFALVLESAAGGSGDGGYRSPLTAELALLAPRTPPSPSGLEQRDPLWDLPIEDGNAPDVCSGLTPPATFVSTAVRQLEVTFVPGRMRSAERELFLNP